MRATKFSVTDRIGRWLDRHGSSMQPAAAKSHGHPVGVMGHLIFVDDDLPFTTRSRRSH